MMDSQEQDVDIHKTRKWLWLILFLFTITIIGLGSNYTTISDWYEEYKLQKAEEAEYNQQTFYFHGGNGTYTRAEQNAARSLGMNIGEYRQHMAKESMAYNQALMIGGGIAVAGIAVASALLLSKRHKPGE